jgi:hypothetical protein
MPIERSGGGGGSGGGLSLLFDSTLAAPAANIDTGAGGIAGGFSHLYYEIYARVAGAVGTDSIVAILNNDSGANYDYDFMRNSGGALSAGSAHAATSMIVGHVQGATATASFFGTSNGNIMSYAAVTAGFKAGNCVCGQTSDVEGTSDQIAVQYTWRSTAAITRMRISAGAGSNLVTGTRLTIYGTP